LINYEDYEEPHTVLAIVYVLLQQLSEMVSDFQKSYKKCAYYNICLFNLEK